MVKSIEVEGVGTDVLILISSILLLFFIGVVLLYCASKSRSSAATAHQPPIQALDSSDESIIARLRTERSNSTSSAARAAEIERTAEPVGDCPICLQPIEFLVVTNCAHYFCAKCLMQCWQYRYQIHALGCPCCRQEVSFLHESFSRNLSSINASIREEAAGLSLKVAEYNRRFSGQPRSVRCTDNDDERYDAFALICLVDTTHSRLSPTRAMDG